MKAVVFTKFSGLTVKDATELRRQLRPAGIDLLVAKKTLIRKAMSEANLDAKVLDTIDGEVALAFGYEDEIAPAKMLNTFAKTHPAIALNGGLVNNQWLNATEVLALAKLPGREQLIAQTVWTIGAPLTGLVNVMAGNIRGLINVLNSINQQSPA